MNLYTFLPLAGGSVALASGLWLLLAKRNDDHARTFFFISLLCLGLFGLFETAGYLVKDKDVAVILLKLAWAAALLAPYFIMSFATMLRGVNNWHKSMAAPMVIILAIALWRIVEKTVWKDWFWYVEYNIAIAIVCFALVCLFMSIGIDELHSLSTELHSDNSPLYKGIRIMAIGFAIWLALALATNGTTFLLRTGIMPLFSFSQLVPTIIVLHGYRIGRQSTVQ